MKIQTTMKYHLTAIRMSIIKKIRILTNVGKDIGKSEALYTTGRNVNKLVQPM